MKKRENMLIPSLTNNGYLLDPTAFRSFETGEVIEKILDFLGTNSKKKLTTTHIVYDCLKENNSQRLLSEISNWTSMTKPQKERCLLWLKSQSFQNLRLRLMKSLIPPNELKIESENSIQEVAETSYRHHFGILSFFKPREWIRNWQDKLEDHKIRLSIRFTGGVEWLLKQFKEHGLEYLLKISNLILHKITDVAAGAMAVIAPGSNLILQLQDESFDLLEKKLDEKWKKKISEWYEKADVRVDDP